MPLEYRDLSGGGDTSHRGESVDRRNVNPGRHHRRGVGVGGTLELRPLGELVVSTERRAQELILSLSGELDLATSSLLERELGAAEAARPARLVVDLVGLQFIDSSGLHTLVQAHARAQQDGRQLSLRHGEPVVRRLFELTDAVQMFPFND
jgi:anti-sigma B factor antagonist